MLIIQRWAPVHAYTKLYPAEGGKENTSMYVNYAEVGLAEEGKENTYAEVGKENTFQLCRGG